jgi:hypothetical protein
MSIASFFFPSSFFLLLLPLSYLYCTGEKLNTATGFTKEDFVSGKEATSVCFHVQSSFFKQALSSLDRL